MHMVWLSFGGGDRYRDTSLEQSLARGGQGWLVVTSYRPAWEGPQDGSGDLAPLPWFLLGGLDTTALLTPIRFLGTV